MAISTVRFNPLDQDFNVPLKTIKQSDPAQILNSASNSISNNTSSFLKTVTKIAQDLNINNIVSKIVSIKNSAENATGILKFFNSVVQAQDAIRRVRGLYQSTIDTNQTASKNLDKIRDKIFGFDSIKNSLAKIIDADYGGKHGSNRTTGKPYSPIVKSPVGTVAPPGSSSAYNTANSNYNYDAIIKSLNVLSGNQYTKTIVDQNSIMQQAVFIGNAAYDANMTGVMFALKNIPNMTPDILARVIAIVMTEQASKGNSAAVLDMSTGPNSVLTTGLTPIYASPFILTDLLTSFTKPPETTAKTSIAVSNALFSSFESIDPEWNMSTLDGIPSTKHCETVSSDLVEVLKSKVVNHAFSDANLTVVFDSDEDALIAAMVANDSTGLNYLKSISTSPTCSKNCVMC